jgi:signal transduction histidine kinase
MKRRRFLLGAHPIQALCEAWAIGLVVALGLSRLVGRVTPFALDNGMVMLCGLSGMWAVVRTRLPGGGRFRQIASEAMTGLALSGAMLALRLPVRALGIEAIWSQADWGMTIASLLLIGTGAGYVIARVALRVWLAWDSLRRRRMLWSLTHAHLMVVVVTGVLGATLLFFASPYAREAATTPVENANTLVSLVSEFLLRIFPTVGVLVIYVGVGLAILLPPSAIFSFLVARRTTRRLDALAATAKALRKGDYTARVAVSGQDEVANLQADFNAMADELARTLADLQVQRDTVTRLLEARREMMASVSHELRTPVATVRAMLESNLARRGDEPSPVLQHDLAVIDGEMARLQRLIDDLFLLARADAGRLELDCRPTDVAATAQRVVDALGPLAWQAGRVTVIADLPAGLPPARADGERLGQVLANLVRNAVRHTEPGGIVAVALRAEPGAVALEVRDTGAGIAPDELPHIWERFFQGEEDRTGTGDGAGLGLALVKELTEAMGGTVAVESAVGKGSCFTVRLLRA